MIAKVNLSLGGTTYQFEFDGNDEMISMHKAIALSNYPTYCTICQIHARNNEFKLTTNRDKDGNTYINLKHTKCGAKVKFGQYKQGGYFWHREFLLYKKDDNDVSDSMKKDISAEMSG